MSSTFDDERENRPIDPSNPSNEHSSEESPDEAMDPNRLAALIEGRVSEHDRKELVAAIGPADAAGVLSDAMAALADVAGAQPTKRVRRRWNAGVWLALAACVAGVLLLPAAWLRTRGASNGGPEQYAALLAAQGVRMPANWNDTPWDVTRGPEALTPEARAFRIGVRVTDLGMAVRQRDTTSAARYAAEIAALVDQVPGGGAVAAAYRTMESGDVSVARASDAARAVMALPASDATRAGAWTESARLAASARDRSFFASLPSIPPRDNTSGSDIAARALQIARQIMEVSGSSNRPDWDRVSSILLRLEQQGAE